MNVYPVIMCGGSGTRLWPASRPSRPKQFLPLTGRLSLFQQTVERARGIRGLRETVVVAGERQGRWLTGQLAELGVGASVILEPEGRESAAAVAVAAAHVAAHDPQGVLVVLASDHHVPDEAAFRETVERAVEAAGDGRIVTLGIQPTVPSEAYGYIRPATDGTVSDVERFVEKPDRPTAETYLAGGYLWNSGNFIATAGTLVAELEAHAPDVMARSRTALGEARWGTHGWVLGETFGQVPKISFDHAVMEHTDRAAVVRATFAWSDLGAWDAIHAALPQDASGNVVDGDAVLLDTSGSLVRVANGRFAALSGVDDLAVVVEDDVVFVSRLERAQNVKQMVDELRGRGRAEIDRPVPVFDVAATASALSRWLTTAALPLWWSVGYDHERSMWRESLTPEGVPAGENRRARVQGRQTWVYATAGRMGWHGPWREAVAAGRRAIAIYAGENGLLRTLMSPSGAVLDDATLLYDQTFVLLALAQARAVGDDTQDEALALLDRIEEHHRHTRGFRETGAHPFQSNAHMHLFEAASAWAMQGGTSERWQRLADEIAELARQRFVDPEGFLREFFTADWEPAPGADGEVVEPGHQFEWAWLLLRAGEAHHDTARQLFDAGLHGVDPVRGVALDRMDAAFRPTTERARLWHQTEWLKAALALWRIEQARGGAGAGRYHEEAGRAAAALQGYLDTPVTGLWHDKLTGDASYPNEPAPASSLYHIVSAITELRESAGMAP